MVRFGSALSVASVALVVLAGGCMRFDDRRHPDPAGSPTAAPASSPAASPTVTPVGSPTVTPVSSPVGSPSLAPVSGPVAFRVRLRAGQTLTVGSPAPDGCPGLDALLDLGPRRSVRLIAYATTCAVTDNEHPGNGRHGVFRTAADIPADRRSGAIRLDAPLGPANLFTQKYYECTNSCKDFTEPVAVIELANPTDPAFPTLTAYSDKGSASLNDLTALVGDLVA